MSERRVNVAQEGAERQVNVEREAVVNNNIISPVQTVNGKAPDATGNIQLEASDVGAPSAQDLSTETSAREQADEQLNTAVSGKQDALSQAQMTAVNSGIDGTKVAQINTNASNIAGVSEKIPAEASASNQLADKAFVVETAQTNSAHFRGNWGTWADVPTDGSLYPADTDGHTIPTSNDYLVVADASDFPVEPEASALVGTWRFKYSGTWRVDGKAGWLPEYRVNETPLTPAQIAALNSGIDSEKVTKLNGIESGAQKNAPNTVVDANYVHTDNNYSTSEKEKLAGVETGAQVNNINSVSVGGVPVVPDENKNVDLPEGGGGVKTLTDADFNYHKTGDTDNAIATWLLSPGIYNFENTTNNDVSIWATSSNVFTADSGKSLTFIVMNTSGVSQEVRTLVGAGSYDSYKIYMFIAKKADGSPAGGNTQRYARVLTENQIEDSLTSSSDSRALSANMGKYLNDNKADKTAFTGTDGTTAGAMGLVPAPATTDAGKVLKADGTWAGLPDGIKTLTTSDYNYPTSSPDGFAPWLLDTGIYRITGNIKWYNNSGSASFLNAVERLILVARKSTNKTVVYVMDGLYSDETPSITIYNQDGSVRDDYSGNLLNTGTVYDALNASGSAYRQRPLSAYQGRVLADRIGRLSSLTTTDKTSLVTAINELVSRVEALENPSA